MGTWQRAGWVLLLIALEEKHFLGTEADIANTGECGLISLRVVNKKSHPNLHVWNLSLQKWHLWCLNAYWLESKKGLETFKEAMGEWDLWKSWIQPPAQSRTIPWISWISLIRALSVPVLTSKDGNLSTFLFQILSIFIALSHCFSHQMRSPLSPDLFCLCSIAAEELWSVLACSGSSASTQHNTVWTLSVHLEVLIQWHVLSWNNPEGI